MARRGPRIAVQSTDDLELILPNGHSTQEHFSVPRARAPGPRSVSRPAAPGRCLGPAPAASSGAAVRRECPPLLPPVTRRPRVIRTGGPLPHPCGRPCFLSKGGLPREG